MFGLASEFHGQVVVFVAAVTELAVKPPNRGTTVDALTEKVALDPIHKHYNTPRRIGEGVASFALTYSSLSSHWSSIDPKVLKVEDQSG
jgi:hypothetical protein